MTEKAHSFRPERRGLRIAIDLVVLATSSVLGSSPAAGQEQAPAAAEKPTEAQAQASSWGLPSVRGLDWQFHFYASLGAFGFANSLYTNPKPDEPSGDLSDNWFEGAVKPGVSATYTSPGSWQLYGKISAAGERNFSTPPTLVGGQAQSFQVEDLYVGWRSGKLLESLGENALDFTVGRAPYQLGHGFLVYDGASEGGSRGGYWSNVRKAFAFAAIGRFNAGPHKLEAFFLQR